MFKYNNTHTVHALFILGSYYFSIFKKITLLIQICKMSYISDTCNKKYVYLKIIFAIEIRKIYNILHLH